MWFSCDYTDQSGLRLFFGHDFYWSPPGLPFYISIHYRVKRGKTYNPVRAKLFTIWFIANVFVLDLYVSLLQQGLL
jgi:hypothetical protein